MIKSWLVKRLFYLVLILFALFVVFFCAYSYISAKTQVDVIDATKVLLGDQVVDEELSVVFSGVENLYKILIAQILTFFISGLSLIFVVWHVLILYYVQKKNALIDPLTEINNRRAIFFGLKRELRRAARFGHDLSVAMIDIDYFKQYNDKNGHPAGDKALIKVAKILSTEIREVDFVGRVGGEEFLIVFPETDKKGACVICEKIKSVIEKTRFVGEHNLPTGSLTVSMGVGTIKKGKGSKDIWLLIAQADKKLYKAKKEGRNKVVC